MCLFKSNNGDSFAAKDQENPRVLGDSSSDGNAPPLNFSNLTHQQMFGTNTTAGIHPLCPCCAVYHLSNATIRPGGFGDKQDQDQVKSVFVSTDNSSAAPQPLFGYIFSNGNAASNTPLSKPEPANSTHQPLFGTNTSQPGGLFGKQDQDKSIFNSTTFPVPNSSPCFSLLELAKLTHQQPLFGTNTSTTTSAAMNPRTFDRLSPFSFFNSTTISKLEPAKPTYQQPLFTTYSSPTPTPTPTTTTTNPFLFPSWFCGVHGNTTTEAMCAKSHEELRWDNYSSQVDSCAAKDQANPRVSTSSANPRVFTSNFLNPFSGISNLAEQPFWRSNTSTNAGDSLAERDQVKSVFASSTPQTFGVVFSDRIASSNTAAFPSFSNLPLLSNHQQSLFGTNTNGGGTAAAFAGCSNLPPLSNHQPSLFGTNTSGGGSAAAFTCCSNLPPLSNHQPSLFGTNTGGGGSAATFTVCSNLPPLSNHQPSSFGINTNEGGLFAKQDIFNSTAFPVPNSSATPRPFFVNYNAASKFSNTAAFPSFSNPELPKSTHQQPPLFGTNTSTTNAAINPLWSGNINFCPCCGQRNVANAAAYPITIAAIPQLSGGGFDPLSNANTAFNFSNPTPISILEPAKSANQPLFGTSTSPTNPFCPGNANFCQCCGQRNITNAAAYHHRTTAADTIPPVFGGSFSPLTNANTGFSFSNSTPISKLELTKFTNLSCPGSCCGVHGNRSAKAAYRPTYDESESGSGRKILSISAMCVHPAKSHEELRWDDYSSQGKSCSNPFVLRGSAQTNSTSFGGGFTLHSVS